MADGIFSALWRNIAQSEVLRIGTGKVYGVIVNSHSSGKFKLYDGKDDVVAVKATAVLTLAGGSMTPAKFAKNILTKTGNFLDDVSAISRLTSNNTNVSDGDTVRIGAKTYTFKTNLTPTEGEVHIGGDADASLLNLVRAINHTGTPDTDYKCAVQNADVSASASVTSHHIDVTARTAGSSANSTVTTTPIGATLSWTGTTLATGTTAGTDAETITIGTRVFRWKNTLAQVDDVKIGATLTASLVSLLKTLNGTGLAGTDNYTGTSAHQFVIASASDATTITVYSRTIGTGNNTLPTTETCANGAWADTTLGGGSSTSIAGVDTADATFVLNGTPYYFTTLLSETLLGTSSAVANEILWVTTDATALDNMKLAINGTGTEGTDYSTGTDANADFIATTNTDTAQTLEARVWGTLGNNLSTTETMVHASFASTTATGGVNGARPIMSEYTLPTGSSVITFPAPLGFVNGLLLVVSSGSADLTPVWNQD